MPGLDDPKAPAVENTPAEPDYIRVEGVSKNFADTVAVSAANFQVEAGETLGFLGSDGAGKTTLLRMIAMMIRPSKGRIRIAGRDVGRHRKYLQRQMGYMPQRFGLYQDLSVSENIDFFMNIYGIGGEERRRRKQRYLGFSNLLPFLDRPAGALSGGMKQKLGLACVLVHEPNLLILDEPTNGVDPVSRREFWEILAQMRSGGMTILVSTAYMDEGLKCDRLMLMHAGRVVDVGTPAGFQAGFVDLEAAVVDRLEQMDRSLAEDRFGL